MVDLGPLETAKSDLGGARPVSAGHFGYQETIVTTQADSLPPILVDRLQPAVSSLNTWAATKWNHIPAFTCRFDCNNSTGFL
jgi:hypothetical protein